MNEPTTRASAKATLALLSLYAIAMALLEAVVVIYMRQLYYPEQPLELFPLQFLDQYDPLVELSREAATILMIVAVALLAERSGWTRRFAAFVLVFGLWDVFYYIWLKVLFGWPRQWLEWDVLFLIPSVWLGPWICPAAIGLMFCIWGGFVLTTSRTVTLSGWQFVSFVAGSVLGLITFMQPASEYSLHPSSEALLDFTPGKFWWWLFVPAYLAMATGLISSALKPGAGVARWIGTGERV